MEFDFVVFRSGFSLARVGQKAARLALVVVPTVFGANVLGHGDRATRKCGGVGNIQATACSGRGAKPPKGHRLYSSPAAGGSASATDEESLTLTKLYFLLFLLGNVFAYEAHVLNHWQLLNASPADEHLFSGTGGGIFEIVV